MISNIVYISASKAHFSRADLLNLLEKCRSRNAARSITGILMYHDQQFFQVLEGDEGAINSCFERISADNRHSSVIPLHKGTSSQRLFADWSMGFVELEELNDGARSEFVNICRLHKHKSYGELKSDPIISIFARNFLNSIAEVKS